MLRRFALCLVIAACGGDDGVHSLPDAPLAEDGATPDAPLGGSVAVTAYQLDRAGSPDTAAVVLFQDASGTLLARAATDANGRATGDVPSGGMVTVVQSGQATTIVAPGDGDELTVGADHVESFLPAMALTLPSLPAGTTTVQVFSPCGSGGAAASALAATVVSLRVTPGCPTTMQPVQAVAMMGGTRLGYLLADLAITADGEAALAGAWQTPAQLTSTIVDLPTSVTGVYVYGAARANGHTLHVAGDLLPGRGPGGTTSMSPPIGDASELGYFVYTDTAMQQVRETFATRITALTVDGDELLPWVESLEPTGSGDGTSATWTLSSGAAFDATLLRFDHRYKNTTVFDWRVVLPPSATTFTLPELPADVSEWGTTNEIVRSVQLIEHSTMDYAQLRRVLGAEKFRHRALDPQVVRTRWSMR